MSDPWEYKVYDPRTFDVLRDAIAENPSLDAFDALKYSSDEDEHFSNITLAEAIHAAPFSRNLPTDSLRRLSKAFANLAAKRGNRLMKPTTGGSHVTKALLRLGDGYQTMSALRCRIGVRWPAAKNTKAVGAWMSLRRFRVEKDSRRSGGKVCVCENCATSGGPSTRTTLKRRQPINSRFLLANLDASDALFRQDLL
ncbi:MAG: hypothetical protein R3A47_03195 [Polyangiales bacterium]